VANTDDVALLKEELAQFLLTEMSSAQGGAAFRREVGDQVGAVIDQILAERLKPALDNLERRAAEQSRATTAALDDALARVKSALPNNTAPATDEKLAEITAALDALRQRLARVEETSRRGAVAQPMQPRSEPKLADERIAAPNPTGSSLPRWLLWLLLLLLALSVLSLGNLYYEKLTKPEPVAPSPVTASPPPAASVLAPAAVTTPAPTPAPTPQQQAVSVPPQTPAAIPDVTPRPAPTVPAAATTPAPQPPPRFPADFAIERGWLAAQPYAVDPRLARRVGSSQPLPTLKSIVCGRTPNCTSDALLAAGMEDEQLIALQMLMSQIGDRFCVPRRSLAVTGVATAAGLADLSAIAKCAGGAPAACRETQNRVCAPDADALQSGSQAARAALLRWALWKTGSI
jgi:hypothetical protein